MIQVPLIKELVCYICGKGITEKDSVRIGGGLRRHRRCKPVTKRRKSGQTGPVEGLSTRKIQEEHNEDTLFP